MKIIANCNELTNINIEKEVKSELLFYLKLIDENYGMERDIIKELGGYAVIVETMTDIQFIKGMVVKKVEPEEVKSIQCKEEHWVLFVFILSADYAVIIAVRKELAKYILEE